MKKLILALLAPLAFPTVHAADDTIVINELMASNAGQVMSPAINFDSWIELYNLTDKSINLSGMYLSNDADNLTLWRMPSNIGTLPANGFLVVWLGSNYIKSNQATFKLDCDGGTIYLSDKNGKLVTSFTYPEAMSRTAYARTTDGGEAWQWTANPSPGNSNLQSVFASQRLDPPVVSHDSQLFTSSLSVSVDIPEGATLMYTTDGSLPSAPPAKSGSASKKSTNGKFSFSQTTNLTLRLYQDGYLPSVPVTRSYIKTSNKYTLPIISIVGDKQYFTDPKTGIDCDGDGTNGKTGNGQNSPRNYNMDWDRPVNFSYMSPEGKMLFNQDVNIKVSGGWTRSQRYRSFKLKSSKLFDGQNRYNYSFFPQKPYIRNKTVLVRNGGNDVWTHNARFLDPALETIIQRSGIDVDVQSCVPVIEYVNGVLRGVFNLREPNNDDFAYANWGYDDEELDAFENEEIKNGTDEVIKRIFELGRHINDAGAYDELKTLLDIDEYTNYMAVTMFLDNDDWPNNNIKGYRSQKDGRYRFVSFDLDYAFALCGNNKYNEDPFKFFLRFTTNSSRNHDFVNLFLNLMGHDEFRRKFIDTFCIVAGSVFEPKRAGAIVDELLNQVQSMCQLMKQQGINDGHEPNRAANEIKTRLNGRSKKMTDYLKSFSYAKLSNTSQSVSLSADTEDAQIFVNGINVPYAQFSGHLFAPVRLEAKAPVGYRFSKWMKGTAILSTESTVDLPSGSSLTLKACFTPLTDSEKVRAGITPVRINEVSADDGIYVNEYWKRNDWVELYNTTDTPVDVEGMYLTDNPDKPKKYQISKESTNANTVIPAHGHLVIWCDKLETKEQLHASFKLAAEGDELQLMAADGSWTDSFVYNSMNSDQTIGRYPDGSSNVVTMNVPTIAKANIAGSYSDEIPQPAPTGINVVTDEPRSAKIYNLQGQTVQGALSPGVYIQNGRKFIKK